MTLKEVLKLLVCILFIKIIKGQGDEVGSVNVGYCVTNPATNKTDISLQLITVTENVASSSLPVYFLLVNNSIPILDDCLVLNEDVLVSCGVKENYTDGDSVVEFEDAIVNAGQDTGFIPFSILQQGRAVEVECTGETISNTGALPPLFATNTSAGITGGVVVKKSPQVSVCDDVVVVPNALAITTAQIELQLSEPVAEENVTVSCGITGITQDINGLPEWVTIEEANDSSWMYLVFQDMYATIGTTDILMTYDIYRRGSLVLVTCYAESDNDGSQYLRNTSASTPTIFLLQTGSVQLLPEISLVPTPDFTAFLLLNSPMQANEGEVVYSCYLIAVNDSLEAREVAENPVCQTPDDVFTRPTASSPTAPSSGCIPIGNVTCAPVTRPGTSPNATQSSWVLVESELIFTEGDVYKPIRARLDSQLAKYQGALVLTCCAAPDINTSPRFTNTSAALLMVSNVNGYRPINWTEASVSETKETAFPNPAYVEMAPCPCDLIQNRCETDCCCDQDCTTDDLNTFTCTSGIPGGDFTKTDAYSCFNTTVYTPDYWPFLCVQISNSPYLGLYYSTVAGIRDLATFNGRKGVFTDDSFTSFRDLGKRTLEFVDDQNNVRLYKNGYPVEQLYSENVRGYLALPQRVPGDGCLWTSPLKYQEDFESSCELTSADNLCTETSVLSARMYLQGSSSSYPACPDAPQVVSKHRSNYVAPTDVVYYCTEDVSAYMVSNLTSKDVLHPNKPSLFPEEEEDSDSGLMSPRCEWDDGYTRPPVPTFNNDTKLCENAVLDVQYEFFWRGGEILSVEANLLLGSINLLGNAQIQVEEETEIDFVSPPPITPPPTTLDLVTDVFTSIIFENETEIVTNITEVYENYTVFGTEATDIGTEGTSFTTNPTTLPQTTKKATTAVPTTTPIPPTTPTTQAVPTTSLTTAEPPTPSGLPTPPVTSTTPLGTTSASTSAPSVQESTETISGIFVQYYSAKFTHLPETTYDPDTGHTDGPGEQYARSGNPGYIIGSRVLTGVGVYDYLPDYDYDCLYNCSLPTSYPGINGTFVVVDDSEDNRLKVWAPGPGSLCSDVSIMDLPFGEDLISGCLLRLGLAELNNCSVLRQTLLDKLASLVPSDVIGKKGNSDVSIAEDWAPIFGSDEDPYDSVNSTSSPEDPVTTPDPLTTRFPGQRYVQDPTPTQIADQLSGVCYDMPTGINVEILIANAGQNRGTVQQEILGARITYTKSKLQLQCSAASGANCLSDTGTNDNSTNNSSTTIPWVQSFLVTSTVTYTKVPAVEPEPVLLHRVGKEDDLCRQDACWDDALYPFTRGFKGDSYEYTLAVTLLTIFFSLGYIAVSQPWLHLP